MKNLLIGLTLLAAMPAFAIDLSSCSNEVKIEVSEVFAALSKLDDTGKYSEAMIDILYHSIKGVIGSSPSCESLEGIQGHYETALKDLK